MPDFDAPAQVPPLSGAEIAEEIWQEVGRQSSSGRLGGEKPEAPAGTLPAASAVLPSPTLPFPALLALEGQAFIDAAYAAVLGRTPDETGAAYVQAQLAAGLGKIAILYRLRNSAEGRRAGRSIPGLRRRYAAYRLTSLPLLGPAAGMALAGLRRMGVLRMLAPRGADRDALVNELRNRIAAAEAAQQALEHTARAALAEQGRLLKALSEQGSRFARQVNTLEESVGDAVLAVADSVASHEARITGLSGRLDAVGETLGAATAGARVDAASAAARIDEAAGALRAEISARVIAAEAVAEQSRQEVFDQQRRIGLMLHALRHPAPPEVIAEDDHALDALYVTFEDRFRGSRADIKQRQSVYLPRLRTAGAGTPDRPVLDIGAGRGEFLELLRDEGLSALGVDLNASMAEACRSLGLDCTQGDALSFLGARPDRSLGAITGFHIIEHLPFKVMVRIMDEALRTLAPGGLLILETPNPANLLTASRYFYLDPTHRNPLPHEMVAMIAEARGFTNPEIVQLHPMTQRFPGADPLLTGALDAIFHGPQDYALIARKH